MYEISILPILGVRVDSFSSFPLSAEANVSLKLMGVLTSGDPEGTIPEKGDAFTGDGTMGSF